MNKSGDLAQLGTKFISFIGDAMLYAWQLFIGQFSILLATRWDAQPVLKLLIVLVVVVVVFALVWRFITEIAYILARVGELTSYALGFLFSMGVLAAMINWLMRTVPSQLAFGN